MNPPKENVPPSRFSTEAILPTDKAQDLLRVLMEGVPDAIFMLDPKGNVGTWNSGAANMKQYAADEIVGRHFSVFYSPEQVAAGEPDRALEIASRQGVFQGKVGGYEKVRRSFGRV
jgi:PAS domain S-box-containing protein